MTHHADDFRPSDSYKYILAKLPLDEYNKYPQLARNDEKRVAYLEQAIFLGDEILRIAGGNWVDNPPTLTSYGAGTDGSVPETHGHPMTIEPGEDDTFYEFKVTELGFEMLDSITREARIGGVSKALTALLLFYGTARDLEASGRSVELNGQPLDYSFS